MARLEGRATMDVEAVLVLSEDEMRALDALFGYGMDAFLKVFYEKMGESYLKPHEKGLRSLAEAVKTEVGQIIHRASQAQEVWRGDRGVREWTPEEREAKLQYRSNERFT